ncbi:NUDIX hydrolase [Candidatus Uabimicrobium amorphum]|uniref:GDP-mannose pyrophosphatase n=1 Tax=Uabimicrobium amorphum TaxID=2596890 RepID=A0A5S9F3B4_UABAM|nr:NUDIX hydrolase [Candidatus Uabimicrobium amorphum]BBM84332.1 NUDIX hydrolase [Candidatus Uabimicrobium amorphum]
MDELKTPIFTITSSKPFGDDHKYYCIQCPDWVNIIPVTSSGEIILVKQYRYGVNHDTIELPAGAIDKKDADPLAGAKRELLEETGYGNGEWISLGWVHPNPAIQSNRCYNFLARDVEKIAEINNDLHEDTKPMLAVPSLVEEWISTGKISHSLAITAFYAYQRFIAKNSSIT